jgi:hypothetical protein
MLSNHGTDSDLFGNATIRPLEWSARRLYVLVTVNIKRNELSFAELPYVPVWTGRLLIFLAAVLFPFYLLDVSLAVLQVGRSASGSWLPVWRLATGDILKLAFTLYWGFYCKNYQKRRASFKARRRDALQMTVLCGLFFAVLSPWYVFLPVLAGCVLIYSWEMRDIRRDERLRVLETSYVTESLPRKSL